MLTLFWLKENPSDGFCIKQEAELHWTDDSFSVVWNICCHMLKATDGLWENERIINLFTRLWRQWILRLISSEEASSSGAEDSEGIVFFILNSLLSKSIFRYSDTLLWFSLKSLVFLKRFPLLSWLISSVLFFSCIFLSSVWRVKAETCGAAQGYAAPRPLACVHTAARRCSHHGDEDAPSLLSNNEYALKLSP